MKPGAVKFLQDWAINTLAVLIATVVLPGIGYQEPYQLLLASLLLGVLNAAVRPFLLFIALPLLVVTLGLFLIVINALLLYFVGWIVPGFTIDGFGSAILGALIIGVIGLILNLFTGRGRARVRVQRRATFTRHRNEDDDNTIDI